MTNNIVEAFNKTKKAGAIASAALDEVVKIVKPGIATEQIDKLCFEFINDHGAYSAPLFYRGFPKSSCISPNHVVCHGIPKDKILREGNVYKVVQQNQSIQTQNIVSAKTSKIEKLIVFDEFTNYLLTVDYDNFKPLGKLLFPVKHSYTSISYMDDTSVPVITNIIFNYNKVSRTNKALKFPFNIPSKYVVEKI